MGNALAAQSDRGVRLGAGLDLDLLLTVDRRHGDGGAECRLGDRDRRLVVELRPIATERWMRRHVDDDVQRAGRAAAGSDLALVGEPDLVALVDAGGDRHPQRPLRFEATFAVTRRTWALDDLALRSAT